MSIQREVWVLMLYFKRFLILLKTGIKSQKSGYKQYKKIQTSTVLHCSAISKACAESAPR